MKVDSNVCFSDHIRLLMNFIEEHEMKLPYFLLNSLKNMSGNVQKRIQFIENTMYHHGLIKILVEFHIQSIGNTWETFLVRNTFEEETNEQPSSSRIHKKRKVETSLEQEPQQQQDLSEYDIPIAEILKKINAK